MPPRPFGRAAPLRFAAVRRDHFGHVLEPVHAATSYTWAFARRVMNRIAHICTGNISAWAGVAAALAAPVLLSVQRGSVGVVDETLAAVAQQSAELVQEVGAEAARTVQVAGRAVSVITLMLCAAAIWFIARAVLNRLVHALKGNSLPATLGDVRREGQAQPGDAPSLGPPGLQAVSLRLQGLPSRRGVRALRCRRPSGRADGSSASGPGHLSFGGCSPCGARLAGDRKGARRPSEPGVVQRLGSKESRDQLPQRPPESWRLVPRSARSDVNCVGRPSPCGCDSSAGPQAQQDAAG